MSVGEAQHQKDPIQQISGAESEVVNGVLIIQVNHAEKIRSVLDLTNSE